MFIDFEFGNFRSFRDVQKFSMEASPLRSNDNGLQEGNVFEKDSFRLLKSKAIYGHNASGKSNFAQALGVLFHMVHRSVAEENIPERVWNDRFRLITDWDDQPIFFQLTFLHNALVYRYGFQILGSKVSYEWLYSGHSGDEVEYFMRTENDLKVNEDHFKDLDSFIKQARSGNNELFRSDSLFLTATALNGSKLTGSLREQIRSIFIVDSINDRSAIDYAMSRFMQGPDSRAKILKSFLRAADTSVEDLEIVELPDDAFAHPLPDEISNVSKDKNQHKLFTLLSYHTRYDDNGNPKDKIKVPFADWESEGTAKLFSVGSLIIDALAQGRTIVIDEFDARFHPNLTLKIVQLFQNARTNPKNAQIIFITHDSGLLRRARLRRDQICLVNKDKFGVSSLSTLIEFKGVRKDASYEKEYLEGSYAAVPFLDELDLITPFE